MDRGLSSSKDGFVDLKRYKDAFKKNTLNTITISGKLKQLRRLHEGTGSIVSLVESSCRNRVEEKSSSARPVPLMIAKLSHVVNIEKHVFPLQASLTTSNRYRKPPKCMFEKLNHN